MIIKRFSKLHEDFSALHDYAAGNDCPAALLDSMAELLSGVECDEDIAHEIAYSLIEFTPALLAECEDLDMTFCDYIDHINKEIRYDTWCKTEEAQRGAVYIKRVTQS